jgi:hypothetical protein
MNRISGILFVAAILLAPQLVAAEPAGPASGKTALQKQPPNIVFILSDDQGWGT